MSKSKTPMTVSGLRGLLVCVPDHRAVKCSVAWTRNDETGDVDLGRGVIAGLEEDPQSGEILLKIHLEGG